MVLNLIDLERLEGDKEYRAELRHRCQTDLLFLAPFIGFHSFRPDLHGPVQELYVAKKPGLAIEDQDTDCKNRLHMDPRHTFKTTAGILDQVQWIISCPEITIANETATKALATDLTKRVGGVFVCPKTKRPSAFQRLFPEFVVQKLKGNYRAPCRESADVEPTIYSTSIGSSQSGYHPWILNPDDIADTENSGIDASDASRDRVWNSYQTNLNTLRHGGYVHIRGTRYHPFDLYGRLLRSMDPSRWKVLIRGSVRVKSGVRLIEGEFPAEDELELLWPGMLSYADLREKFYTDYRSFMCQQQNDPQGGGVATFPPEVYDQAQIEESRIPQLGNTRICWRLPCEAKTYMSRYAVGTAVRELNGRMYVVDAWYGNYTPSELADRVVSSCKRHGTGELTIEKTPGSEFLIPHITQQASLRNVGLRIDQPAYEADDTRRKGRCAQLEPMMRAGRIWFSNASGQRERLRTQFTNFGLTEDIGLPDVISRLALRLPVSTILQQATAAQIAARQSSEKRQAWDVIYGAGGAQVIDDAIGEATKPSGAFQNSYGFRSNVLGGLDG